MSISKTFTLPVLIFAHCLVYGQMDERIGSALLEKGNFAEALPYFDRLVNEFPGITVNRYNRAVCLFNLGKLEASLADYKILAKEDQEESEYFFQVANLMEQLNQLDSVEYYYTVALQLDRKDFLKFFKRGTYYLKKEKWQKAIYDYNQALALNPNHYNSYHNRGIANFKIAQIEKACEDWCQAVTLGSPVSAIHIDRNCSKYAITCKPR